MIFDNHPCLAKDEKAELFAFQTSSSFEFSPPTPSLSQVYHSQLE
jgi:hypothetical protein